MGTWAPRSEVGSCHWGGHLAPGKMSVVQRCRPSSRPPGATATTRMWKMPLVATNMVPKPKLFWKRLVLHYLLTGIQTGEPANNNEAPRRLKKKGN